MAYSSVRVQFEIGHEASVRNKRTPEGFTHDWEVFVRGADKTEIQHFVEKVVFHLHETFQKPKRVVKEPPYSVKECGYAGFVLPVDVYLKNKEEPKKINFQYDLQLQSSGPPISRVLREPRVFQNPSEDFRRNLIRGGGVGVDSPLHDSKPSPKKVTQSPRKLDEPKATLPKKHKADLPLSNSFADLFGTPIRRVTPEPKKTVDISARKGDLEKKKLSKPNIAKDDKDITREKDKEKSREKDKGKDKSKRPVSPPVTKLKHDSKEKDDREKKKEDNSNRNEKDRKEKHKDKEPDKVHKKEKKSKEPDIVKKNVAPTIERQGSVEKDISKEKPEKERHKHRHKKREKEKSREKEKHKHKEKGDKERTSEKRKYEEANGKIEKVKKLSRSPSPVRERPRKGALGALFNELSDSASPLSEDEEESLHSSSRSAVEPAPKVLPEIKFSPVADKIQKETANEKKSKSNKEDELPVKSKKEKSPKKKGSKSLVEPDSKRSKFDFKRDRSSSIEREKELELIKRQKEEQERKEKEEAERRAREKEEELAKKAREAEAIELQQRAKAAKKEKESKKRNREKQNEAIKLEEEQSNLEEPPPRVEFTKEYVAQLRDLQQRIMSLEDNAELQKVVKMIAESGQYEVTKKTFDFDLCNLDYGTVRRLQEFFSMPT